MKRMVRQGIGASRLRRMLPPRFGGVESSAGMMQRLLLLREFNYEPDIMSTPDWLWGHDHAARRGGVRRDGSCERRLFTPLPL